MSEDIATDLVEMVKEAAARKTPLSIAGGDTKSFYGRMPPADAKRVEMSAHRGVVSYEPSELYITVRAGTRLSEVNAMLEAENQRLPFEPPELGESSTIGGVVAAGLSGPRRPWHGAVRDAVLGVKIINGRGEVLRFGGEVMKNVAGYDLSRVIAGSMGTLGILLEVSLKVKPRFPCRQTVVHEVDSETGIRLLRQWSLKALSFTGACHDGDHLYVRVCGGEDSLRAALEVVEGTPIDHGLAFWCSIRDMTHPFFAADRLWRISVPPAAQSLQLEGRELVDWGGAQRWLHTDLPAETVRERARALGGHATLFRGHDGREAIFQPLAPALMKIHQRFKQSLDPHGIFNPGRLYPEL